MRYEFQLSSPMLTETETPRIYYELVKIIFVSICLNIKNIEERNTEDKFFNQVHVPNTGSPMLQNLFLAQSMRTSKLWTRFNPFQLHLWNDQWLKVKHVQIKTMGFFTFEIHSNAFKQNKLIKKEMAKRMLRRIQSQQSRVEQNKWNRNYVCKPSVKCFGNYGNSSVSLPFSIHHHMLFASRNQVTPKIDIILTI